MSNDLFLIDSSVYVFRAYFSVSADMQDSEGNPSNAVYGFTGFLLSLLEQTRPGFIAAAFDESLTTSFRNEIYPEYKANRDPAPAELKRQFAHCRAIAEMLGISCFSDNRFEADDIIGTLSSRKKARGQPVHIVSSDKDLAQLVGEGDTLWDFARNRRMDADAIVEKFGVRPDQIADYLALTGDAVDNIPGVNGIGPKSAAALIAHFDSLDSVLERRSEIEFLSIRGAKSIQKKIDSQQDEARLARQLTGISMDVPVADPEPELDWKQPDLPALNELFDYLNIGQLTRRRCEHIAGLWSERQ